MGRDKALLHFCGQTMVELAVHRLNGFCTDVSIAGNRDDLSHFAPVVHEQRLDTGPAAGLEAGLAAATQRWALFTPVDVPLVPGTLLEAWCSAVLRRESDGVRLSYLRVAGTRQPTFCLLHAVCQLALTSAVQRGERKLGVLFQEVSVLLGPDVVWEVEAEDCVPEVQKGSRPSELWFTNVNTPEDLSALKSYEHGSEAGAPHHPSRESVRV